ncbi:MAG: hypothetical protein ACOC0Z_07740 [Halohasta sp.]
MDSQRYRKHVETTVTEAGYEELDRELDDFESVWQKRTEDPTIGVTEVFATVVDAEGFDTDDIAETAEAFRESLTTVAPSSPGSMENLFGYVVFALADPGEELVEFATEEYTVADRRTSVFPLCFDLDAETLYTHAVPRLKGRGFYEKQRLDAEELFVVE